MEELEGSPKTMEHATAGKPAPPSTPKAKARPKPKETPKQKAARLERERDQLLHDIAATNTDDLRAQIGYVLSHDPLARDSDVRLAHQIWETFSPDLVEGEWVRLKDMYRLPRQNTISRTRATIQNEYRLFLPSVAVAKRRRLIQDDTKAAVLADKPGPPVLSVYADESSQTGHRFTVVGSVWCLDISRVWRVVRDLDTYKREHGIDFEFKFADLNKKKLPLALGFVKEAVKHAGLISMKACVLDTHVLGPAALSGDERLYRLYYELAMTGIEHEVKAGRVALPRGFHLVKDASAEPDALLLPEVERRLKERCAAYFEGAVQVEPIMTGLSHESSLLQLADLFAGSAARKFNQKGEGQGQHPKDALADFFESVAGFDFVTGDQGPSDFVYVHRLGLSSKSAPPGAAEPQFGQVSEVTGESGFLTDLPEF